MADYVWRERVKMAVAVLFFGASALGLLDVLARPAGDDGRGVMVGLAATTAVLGALAAMLPWQRWSAPVRLVPAATVLGVIAVAIGFGEVAAAPHGPVGLTIVAALLLIYVGFATDPGMALSVSPAVLGVLYLAHRREPDRVSLALPLIAVPVTALVGELVAALADRVRTDSERSRQRLSRLSQLEEVLRGFHRPGSLRDAAHQVANAAVEIFGVERSTVVLRDSTGGLIPVSVGPQSASEPDGATAALVAETILGDEPRLVPTTGTNGTMLVLPLPAADAPAGAVLVYPVPDDDPEFTLDLARLFGVQVGIAIEHLYVIDELSRESTRDALTGIGNRRHADMLLNSLEPGDALVLLDLDFLKTVNDTMGHAAGDQVLQELSGHLRECLRDSDTSARLGGDEFLIVARRAHANPMAVAGRVLSGWVGKGGITTLSAGVALHDAEVTSSVTFERADEALYAAKAAGKDQAKLWRPPAASSARGTASGPDESADGS